MDKAELAAQLASSVSIKAIARVAGRDPSTVAYWVNKYGLESSFAPKHASRGGISRELLEELVDAGLSVRAIAERVGMSYATVRHWLKKYGLETARARRRGQTRPRGEQAPAVLEGICHAHGRTEFARRADGYYRCLACRSEAVVKRRRTVKRTLVEEAGGACALCGYNRSMAALQFHHLQRSTKAFSLSHRGVTLALSAARAEAAKCVLLCSNCHAEVEAGVATVDQVLTMEHEPPVPGSSEDDPG
jgi:DNA-binding transcriptional ArsR family regulator